MTIQVNIISPQDIVILKEIHDACASFNDMQVLIRIWQEYDLSTLHQVMTRKELVSRGKIKTIQGKEVLTTDGWQEVLSVLPIVNGDDWIVIFADSPDKAQIYNSAGYSKIHRMYLVRDKATPENDNSLTSFD